MKERNEIRPGYKKTRVGCIPEEWECVRLARCIDVLTGYPFRSTHYSESENDVRLLRGDNVIHCKIRWEGVKRWPFPKSKGLSKYELVPGDIVLAMDRTWVGTGLKCAVIQDHDIPCYLVQRVARIRGTESAKGDFWVHHLLSHRFEQYVKNNQTETAVPHISKKQIEDFNIPLPPLPEQKRIVEVLSAWDREIALTDRLIGAKQRLKKGLLQQLLSGRTRFPEFGKSVMEKGELPEGWMLVRLGDIAEVRRGASPRPIKDPKWFAESGRGWIRIADITTSHIHLKKTSQYLSKQGVGKSVVVEPEDLILSICATIGVPIIVDIPSCIHDGFVLIRQYARFAQTMYLFYFFASLTESLAGKGQPGTQKNLNSSIVNRIQIPLPSLPEQRRILATLSACDRAIQLLTQKRDRLKEQKKGLMQKLLTGEVRVKVRIKETNR